MDGRRELRRGRCAGEDERERVWDRDGRWWECKNTCYVQWSRRVQAEWGESVKLRAGDRSAAGSRESWVGKCGGCHCQGMG